MFWYLFLSLILILFTLPMHFTINFKINLLNLSIELNGKLFMFQIKKIKIKLKKDFIYITKKGKTYKEKLKSNNVDVIFTKNFMRDLYFRLKLNVISLTSEFGVKNNAFGTALGLASYDLIVKGMFAKIKNNKKSAHIFLSNCAKYNDDCLTFLLVTDFELNIFDIIYSLIMSKIKSKGVKYERIREREQSENLD